MKTKYLKTAFLSLSICFIFSATFSTPDTLVMSVGINYIWTGNFGSGAGGWGNGRFNLSFDQSRNMPPGDQMYVEVETYSYCCGHTPWHKLTGSWPVNWYNDAATNSFTGHTNGTIHTSIDIGGGGGSIASINIRFVYISATGGAIHANIYNAKYDFAPTHLGNVTATLNSGTCSNPLDVTFHLPIDCYQCSFSSYDTHIIADFGDGIDTFYTVNPSGGYTILFHLNHTYNSIGTFNATFHIYNPDGGGSDTLIVSNHNPAAAITASSTTFCSGDSVVLNALYHPDRTYQWTKGGINISGATTSSYTTKVGGAYRVNVTNTISGCSRTTAPAKILTKYQFPVPTITPQGPTTFCAGDSVILSANTGTGLTYHWKKDGIFIGITTLDYTSTTAGVYKVQEINSYGCKRTSGGITVTVPCREGDELKNDRTDFLIFPNPSTGFFTIETTGEKISQITITSLSGQIIYKNELTGSPSGVRGSYEIDLTNQSKGIYLIQALTDKSVYNQKILIQ